MSHAEWVDMVTNHPGAYYIQCAIVLVFVAFYGWQTYEIGRKRR